jgi:hypothetical protein
MSTKGLHSVYQAASRITVHRYATAVGHAGTSESGKAAKLAPPAKPSARTKKSAPPAQKGG